MNSIAPGRIDTERIREVYPDGPTEADLEAIPLRRLGTPREIGDVVAFLCSDRAAYVTGAVVAGRRRPRARAALGRAGAREALRRHPRGARRHRAGGRVRALGPSRGGVRVRARDRQAARGPGRGRGCAARRGRRRVLRGRVRPPHVAARGRCFPFLLPGRLRRRAGAGAAAARDERGRPRPADRGRHGALRARRLGRRAASARLRRQGNADGRARRSPSRTTCPRRESSSPAT